MNDTIKTWIFILLLPFLAAIGHDVWASLYADQVVKTKIETQATQNPAVIAENFKASDFGYLLVNYTPKIYEKVRGAVGEPNWVKFIDPILKLYTSVVALFPLIAFCIWLVIARAFDIWPFQGRVNKAGKIGAANLHEARDKGSEFKYKRK